MNETIVGIDASLTNTAVCVYRRDGTHEMHVFKSERIGDRAFERLQRYERLANRVVEVLPNQVEEVFLEHYSFGSKGAAILDIAEFGAILRRNLLLALYTVTEIPPTVLKTFATSKGNADKLKVCLSLSRAYNVQFDSDDEFDAYGLSRLGACVRDWEEPKNEAQRRAASVVLGVKIEKPKKKKAS